MEYKSLLLRFIIWVLVIIFSMIEITSSFYLIDHYRGFKFYNQFCKISYFILTLIHPFIIVLYSFIVISVYVNTTDEDFDEISEKDQGEKVYFFLRNMSQNIFIRIPVVILVATLAYFKIFPVLAFIFLPNTSDVKKILYSTLFPFLLIHIIVQTIPTLIIRYLSAELNRNSILFARNNFLNNISFILIGLGVFVLITKKYF